MPNEYTSGVYSDPWSADGNARMFYDDATKRRRRRAVDAESNEIAAGTKFNKLRQTTYQKEVQEILSV